MDRLPTGLRYLAYCLGSEFGCRYIEEDVGTRSSQIEDLRIHCRVLDLVRKFGNDWYLTSKTILEALDVVLPKVIVLIENADSAFRMVLQEVLRVDAPFELITRPEADRPGKVP